MDKISSSLVFKSKYIFDLCLYTSTRERHKYLDTIQPYVVPITIYQRKFPYLSFYKHYIHRNNDRDHTAYTNSPKRSKRCL